MRFIVRFARTREPELAALPIQYGDFARWQREKLSGGALAELVDFWRHQLADAPSRPTSQLIVCALPR